MPLAIQEDMLPGRSVMERLENAKTLGFDGVEFWAKGLTERVPEIVEAMEATGVRAAAVNLGPQDGYLSPHMQEREAAISRMRQAMADSVDLMANQVVFVPHFGSARMPDLTPYRAPIELEAEMMIWLLRTVSDLSYALDVMLYMLPVNHYESYFMNTVSQAVQFRGKIKNHPHIKVAASIYHMALEEADLTATLRDNKEHISYLHIADNNRRLPGQGLLDFAAIGSTLKEIGYTGWLTLECGMPGNNADNALSFYQGMAGAAQVLKGAGLVG